MTSYKSNDFVRSTHEPPGALRYESTATRQDTSRPKSSSMNQLHYTHTSSLRTSLSSSSRPRERYGRDEEDEVDEDMLESVYNTLSSSSISRDYAQSISRGHSIYSSDDSWKAEGKLSSERSLSHPPGTAIMMLVNQLDSHSDIISMKIGAISQRV